MTRTATKVPDAAWAGACALAFAAALTAMFELFRAPLSADFILPRRPGFFFFEFFIAARQNAALRSGLVWTATGLFVAAAAGMAWRVRRKASALVFLGGASWALARSAARVMTLLGAREELNPADPAAAFSCAFALAACAAMAVLSAGARWRGLRTAAWSAGFIFLAALPYLARAPERRRPASSGVKWVAVFNAASPGGVEIREVDGEFSAAELRRELFQAHEAGDVAARMNLLDNLSRAPDEPASREMLERLADEAKWRVGPRGAAMLSRAYARFGDAEKSAYWLRRADIPAGLFAGPASGPRGTVSGTLSGLGPVTVALFAHDDPEAPYDLEPSRLVASAAVDGQGRFQFEHLAPGYYFLAAVLKDSAPLGFKISSKGDIHLTALEPVAAFQASAR